MSRQITNISAIVNDRVLQSIERNGAFVSEVDFGDGSGPQEVRLPINTAIRGDDIGDETRRAFNDFIGALDLDVADKKLREIQALQARADTLQEAADKAQKDANPEEDPTTP